MTTARALARREIRLPVLRPRLVATVVVALVLTPRMRAAGSPFDEGGLLAYADRILHGQLPMRDLHSFYGPLSTYLPAAVFKIAGPSLYAERALGLVYRVVLVAALLGLVRRHGTPAVAAATMLLLWLLPSQGVAAFATYGALACTAAAILLADRDRPFAAGLAGGVALLLRFDWALAVALAAVPFLLAWRGRARLRLLLGGVAGVLAYVPYLAFVGPAKVRVFLHGVRTGQAGRHLPVSFAPHGRGLLLDLTLAAICVLGAVGLSRRRSEEGPMLLSVALAAVGLLPYAFDRADRQHVTVAAILPVVVLAAAVPAALGERRARIAALVAAVVVLAALGPSHWLDLDVVSASLDSGRNVPTVSYGGRSFRIAQRVTARAANLAVRRAAAVAPPRGSLFVGPGDLRATSFADAYVYFLLPQLRPATFYITLDPGSTNLPGEHLAGQLVHADVLVLNDSYDVKASGPSDANRVVARDFCLRGHYPPFRVYARCRASAANTGTALRRARAPSPSA